MNRLFFSFLFFLSTQAFGQGQAQENPDTNSVKIFPSWTFWVPGATHFYEHRIAEGILYSAAEIGGISLGIIYKDKLKSNSSSPYYNFPLLVGLQAFNMDKCDYLRNQLEFIKQRKPDFKYDPVSLKEIYMEPFKPKNFLTPITGGFVLLAGAVLYIESRSGINSGFNKVDQFYLMNAYVDRNPAMAVYAPLSMVTSMGAGISEEYWFRNYAMPLMDYRMGQTKGLIFSSLIFGAGHFSNVLFEEKPNYGAALLQVAEASIAGYFLGRDVQKRNYKIGPAIAAHTWYDFTLMLGSFLVNPKNNVFGVNVKFKI